MGLSEKFPSLSAVRCRLGKILKRQILGLPCLCSLREDRLSYCFAMVCSIAAHETVEQGYSCRSAADSGTWLSATPAATVHDCISVFGRSLAC